MKKLFLSLEQVIKILNHSKDKVMGLPIDKIGHPHWLISDINLVTENGEAWNVVVWSKGDGSEGVEEDFYGHRKWAIMKYLLVYLRDTNQLSPEESDLWF